MHVLHRSHTGTTSEGDAFVDTQPRLSKLSIRGLLTLPYRLCNPPPAVGKVRSCGLTPLFKVQLEDVLARKHLPPLSLKDFEEWLLFIEQCPENLYFVLWLREYERKWAAWERRQQRNHDADAEKGSTRVTFSPGSALSPSLALSFERARATFCTPGAPYELCVPPELLAPFFTTTHPSTSSSTTTTHSSHPEPAAFAALSTHLHTRLRGSLARCVRAAYSNVGTFRATCGILGGLTITLIGAGIPLIVEFVVQGARGSRWARLAALPGLWLGLTIIVASLRGVCMMVYIFGDFRQLRRFELERPPAPAPAPVPAHQQHQQNHPCQEKAEGRSRSRSANSNNRGAGDAVDERRKSSVSVVSTSSSLVSSSSSSVYSTSSNPTNPMAAHAHAQTYLKKPPSALHVHSPIRALTAPPRIAVRIPEGRSFSVVSGPVGSERTSGARSSFSVSVRRESGEGDEESVVSSESDEDDDDDASEESDHGIYVSPQYAAPDELAALDAQGVQAALAMARRMAGEAQQQQQQQQIQVQSSVGEIEAEEVGGESPVSIVVTSDAVFIGGTNEVPSATTAEKEKEKEAAQPQQTARFIPAYLCNEYEEERDTWECDSPTSSSGGSAASGSGSGSVSKSFVGPVKKRVTALFSSSSSSGVEKDRENLEDDADEAGRGPCWNIRTRSRSGRRSRTTSLGSRSVASARTNNTDNNTENVDLEKGVVEEGKRGRSRRKKSERETEAPFDFDSLPPREGRPRPSLQLQHHAYNFNQAHIDVNALQFSHFPPSSNLLNPNTLPQGGTMTDAVAVPEPEGPLDRLWAFFCPLKNTVRGPGGFSERLFGASTGVVDLEKSATSTVTAPGMLPTNYRWESSPPPPYALAAGTSSFPSSPISPSQAQHPFGGPPNLPAPVDANVTSPAWQSRFAQAARVPAFGPVTRILSPVVTRAQWEIVVRSFLLAGLLSGMIIGGLLGVPVKH